MSDTKNLKKLGKKTEYPTTPSADILETFENQHPENFYVVPFIQTRDEFTSLCPRTGQPDFARIEILYVPHSHMIESKSLKLYLFSFRDTGEFHEDVINRIFNDIWGTIAPKYLQVYGDFAARGGIAIKPFVSMFAHDLEEGDCEQIKTLLEIYNFSK